MPDDAINPTEVITGQTEHTAILTDADTETRSNRRRLATRERYDRAKPDAAAPPVRVEVEPTNRTDDPPADPSAVDAIAEMRQTADRERAAREEAERRADVATRAAATATAHAVRFRDAADQARYEAVTGQLAGLDSRKDGLKSAYASAMEGGDFNKAADLQFEITKLGTDASALEREKANLETQRAERAEGGRTDPGARQQQQQPSEADQREQFLGTRTAPTAAWIRQHPQFFTDSAFQKRVVGADSLWEADGKPKDTAEYFDFIERTIGLKKDQPAVTETTPARPAARQQQQQPRRAAPTAAPPSRDGGTLTSTGRPGDKVIPAEMARFARDVCKVDPEQYYDDYVSLVQSGEIADRFGIFR